MSKVEDFRCYVRDYGVGTLTLNLGRRASQHARYHRDRRRAHPPAFTWQGTELHHFWHEYNRTWLSERALEIPIAREFLAGFTAESRGLEIGNVLGHYQAIGHRVVDKYERSPAVENIDVVDVTITEPLDFVIALSTLEHVGWDEPVRDVAKAPSALDHLRSLLRPDGGRLLLTAPLGHNPGLDARLLAPDSGAVSADIYVRDRRDRWEWVDRPEPWQIRYLYDLRSAGCLWVGQFESKSAPSSTDDDARRVDLSDS